jgi:hypothetical protein
MGDNLVRNGLSRIARFSADAARDGRLSLCHVRLSDFDDGWPNADGPPIPQRAHAHFTTIALGDRCQVPSISNAVTPDHNGYDRGIYDPAQK